MDTELFGYISSGLLAICGLPTMLISIKNKNSDHIDPYLLSLWFLGEILGLIYVILLASAPLIINYGLNSIILTVIILYKLYPKRNVK